LGRKGAWFGRDAGAEGRLGRKGVLPGAEGSMRRKGAWGARHTPTHRPHFDPQATTFLSPPVGKPKKREPRRPSAVLHGSNRSMTMQRSLSTMLLALLAAPQPAALLNTNETLLGGIFLAAARPFERPSVASLLRACACFVGCICVRPSFQGAWNDLMAGLCVMEQTVVPSCVPGLLSASGACERSHRSFTACADSCALRSTCPGGAAS
jgi:hypothetical protein